MPRPNVSWRFFTSPGLIPEAATRMRTSPGAGSGVAISPTTRTLAGGPCRSYQAAFMTPPMPPEEVGRTHDEFDRSILPQRWQRCNRPGRVGGEPAAPVGRTLAPAPGHLPHVASYLR